MWTEEWIGTWLDKAMKDGKVQREKCLDDVETLMMLEMRFVICLPFFFLNGKCESKVGCACTKKGCVSRCMRKKRMIFDRCFLRYGSTSIFWAR